MATLSDFIGSKMMRFYGVIIVPNSYDYIMLPHELREEAKQIFPDYSHIALSRYDAYTIPSVGKISTKTYMLLTNGIVFARSFEHIRSIIVESYAAYMNEKYWIMGFEEGIFPEKGVNIIASNVELIRRFEIIPSAAHADEDDDREEDDYAVAMSLDYRAIRHPTEERELIISPNKKWIGAEFGRMVIDCRDKPIGDILSIGVQEIPPQIAALERFESTQIVIRSSIRFSPASICGQYRVSPLDVSLLITKALARTMSSHGAAYHIFTQPPIHEEMMIGEITVYVLNQSTEVNPITEILDGYYKALIDLIHHPDLIAIEPPIESRYGDGPEVDAYVALNKNLSKSISSLLSGGVLATIFYHSVSSYMLPIVEWVKKMASSPSIIASMSTQVPDKKPCKVRPKGAPRSKKKK